MYAELPYHPFFSEKNAQKNQPFLTGFTGADTQIRTGDLILTKDALYRLSYISVKRGNGDILHPFRRKCKRKI